MTGRPRVQRGAIWPQRFARGIRRLSTLSDMDWLWYNVTYVKGYGYGGYAKRRARKAT
jgi:hypothetical protein